MSRAESEATSDHPERLVRAVTHVHTTFSWDGRIDPDRLAKRCSELEIGLLLVTDHDTFEGSMAVADTARRWDLPLEVPVAAEVRTEHGDIIVILPGPPEVDARRLKRWDDLVPAVRDMGGVISLAHPYRSHTEIERLAESCDTIEVFNARCTIPENRRARDLSRRLGRPGVVGSDAHLLGEIENCISLHDLGAGPLAALASGTRDVVSLAPARASDVALAQATSGWRHRNFGRYAYHGVRWAVWSVMERI